MELHACSARTFIDDADGNALRDAGYTDTYGDNSANVYEVIVVATDEGGLASTPQTITVTLEDALAPTINAVDGAVQTTAGGVTTATLTRPEGQAGVYAFTASDETDVYWSITGGANQGLFDIDANTGALTFKTADDNGDAIDLPSYISINDENYNAATSNQFEVTIQASDSSTVGGHTSELTVKVLVPRGQCCAEHHKYEYIHSDEGVTSVATLQASDTSNVVWTIDGGANQADFIISASGELQFGEAPNILIARVILVDDADGNAPGDAGYTDTYDNSANVYEVIVEATDEGGLTSTPQTITVTLEDALAPTINAVDGAVQTTAAGVTTATPTRPEGQAGVYAFTASDETDVYWSITGGANQGLFDIDANTGALTFKTADDNGDAIDLPSYISINDENYNAATSNQFEVTIQASDSSTVVGIPVS